MTRSPGTHAVGLLTPTAPVLQHILTSSSISSPNVPVVPRSSTTALHTASEIGRLDAVRLLLNDPRTNDTLRDAKGRTPLECAANQDVSAIIEGESRNHVRGHAHLASIGRVKAGRELGEYTLISRIENGIAESVSGSARSIYQ
jgi:hypothetical protein